MKRVHFCLNDDIYRATKKGDGDRPTIECLQSWRDEVAEILVHEWKKTDHYEHEGVTEAVFEYFLRLGGAEPKVIDPPWLRKVLYQTSEGGYYMDRREATRVTLAWTAPLVVRTREDLPEKGMILTKSFVPLLFQARGSFFRSRVEARKAVGPDYEIKTVPIVLGTHLPHLPGRPLPQIVDGRPIFWTTEDPL